MLKKLTIATWPIEKLKPYERNPRKNDGAVNRMCKSIQEFGFAVPVLAKRDGEVIDGHLRLKAAVKLGLAEVPVIVCDGWSTAQVKAFRLMVNRSVTWADWDLEALGAEFLELKAMDFDLKLTGFDWHETHRESSMDNLYGTSADEKAIGANALAEKWQTATGQLWEIPSNHPDLVGASHRLLIGDSTADLPALLRDVSPDGICSDPDYSLDAGSLAAVLNQCATNKAIMLLGDSQAFALATHWTYRMLIVFKHRTRLGMNKHLPLRSHTLAVIYTKSPDITYGFRRPTPGFASLQEDVPGGCYEGGGDKDDYPMGQQKSAAVFEIMLSGFGWRTVLDPFAGTGASLLACEQTGRRWLGMELNPATAACLLERAAKNGLAPTLAESPIAVTV